METREHIYLDNAASSWPKPESVIRAVELTLREAAANPGRSGHSLSVEAARIISDARSEAAAFFGVADPLRIVFTKNATESLNIVINGLLRPGDHVITSRMEHNSVMRPLNAARERGISISSVRCSRTGELDPDDVRKAVTKDTRLVVLTHASNVTGTIMPVAEVGAITRGEGIPFCVDAAQSAGCLPIDVDAMNIDLLAFTGHKALYGPQGTGGLFIRGGLEAEISPLVMGGTGSASEHEEQPLFMPDKYESGTPNTAGIAGLLEGGRFVSSQGIASIRDHEMALASVLLEGLDGIPGVRVHGPAEPEKRIPVVSFTVDGMDASEVAYRLDDGCGIMVRPGLHCAPSAHRTLGTFPGGTVRFGFGFFNTAEQVRTALEAVSSIVNKP
ncbi:MAG: aminotransferase class V-fold PLP-dependent enzyme [Desulfobacterota bacterium]|nr:aminotransferase class V-fold PLP-dependent enzyme [Thermodesulfobacteriota bacterium]